MRAWILSIVGVVFMGVMIDVIAPQGKTNTFVKSIFSLILLYIIATPIINMINQGVNLKTQTSINVLDQNLLNEINEQKLSEMRALILSVLVSNNLQDYDVEVMGNLANNSNKPDKIKVYYIGSGLLDKDKHIHNTKVVKQLICQVTQVSEEVVVFE